MCRNWCATCDGIFFYHALSVIKSYRSTPVALKFCACTFLLSVVSPMRLLSHLSRVMKMHVYLSSQAAHEEDELACYPVTLLVACNPFVVPPLQLWFPILSPCNVR